MLPIRLAQPIIVIHDLLIQASELRGNLRECIGIGLLPDGLPGCDEPVVRDMDSVRNDRSVHEDAVTTDYGIIDGHMLTDERIMPYVQGAMSGRVV
jgi:hypothetical protein